MTNLPPINKECVKIDFNLSTKTNRSLTVGIIIHNKDFKICGKLFDKLSVLLLKFPLSLALRQYKTYLSWISAPINMYMLIFNVNEKLS